VSCLWCHLRGAAVVCDVLFGEVPEAGESWRSGGAGGVGAFPEGAALVAATVRELEEAGRLWSVSGQQAVRLAELVGSSTESASGVAVASREFRAVLAAALDGVAHADDPVDELRRARDRKKRGVTRG
jgi:hypothetical protein